MIFLLLYAVISKVEATKCNSRNFCHGSQHCCSKNNVCRYNCTGEPCTSSRHCAPGEYCCNATCALNCSFCNYDSHCASGEYCCGRDQSLSGEYAIDLVLENHVNMITSADQVNIVVVLIELVH